MVERVSDYKFALDESAIVAIINQKGIITHVNSNFCKISKYTAGELIGKDHRIVNSGYHTDIKVDFRNAPTLNFSRKNLESIFANLIGNALKYKGIL